MDPAKVRVAHSSRLLVWSKGQGIPEYSFLSGLHGFTTIADNCCSRELMTALNPFRKMLPPHFFLR